MTRCPFCHGDDNVTNDQGSWEPCCQAAHDDYVARCHDDHDIDDATLTLIIDSFYGADEP